MDTYDMVFDQRPRPDFVFILDPRWSLKHNSPWFNCYGTLAIKAYDQAGFGVGNRGHSQAKPSSTGSSNDTACGQMRCK